MIVKILISICISIYAIVFMSMFLTGCTSDADKEYEDSEQMKYIEERKKREESTTHHL